MGMYAGRESGKLVQPVRPGGIGKRNVRKWTEAVSYLAGRKGDGTGGGACQTVTFPCVCILGLVYDIVNKWNEGIGLLVRNCCDARAGDGRGHCQFVAHWLGDRFLSAAAGTNSEGYRGSDIAIVSDIGTAAYQFEVVSGQLTVDEWVVFG